MTKLSISVRLFCSLLFCLLAACSGAAPTPVREPIKVEWTLWQGDYTLLVANQMGFFKKHGLNVEPVHYDSVSQAIPDLAGAKLDGGLFTMSDLILATNLTSLSGVLVSDNGGVYTIVASSDIKSVQDLRGKRIGLNFHTSSEMFVSNMLRSGRMTSNDVVYVEMSPDQVTQSIPGKADAGLVWEPYTTQALAQGKKVVYQSATNSTLIPKMLVFRNTFIQQHPEDIRNFVLAWDEAVKYRLSHPQESLAIISKATGLPQNELSLKKDTTIYSIADNAKLFADRSGKDLNSIYFIFGLNREFLITNGYITDPPSVYALLDPSFLK